MKCFRIRLTSWTSSFRYPAFISGYQPSLPVPPVSTVYGLMSAACGTWITPKHADMGYVFQSQGSGVDLESVYEISSGLGYKQNICHREFLADAELYLYVLDGKIADGFRRPVYPLLLGRSSDLAMVQSIDTVELEQVTEAVTVRGTVVPQRMTQARLMSHALPTHFTEDIPRRAMGTQVYAIVNKDVELAGGEVLFDRELDWGVYFHGQRSDDLG